MSEFMSRALVCSSGPWFCFSFVFLFIFLLSWLLHLWPFSIVSGDQPLGQSTFRLWYNFFFLVWKEYWFCHASPLFGQKKTLPQNQRPLSRLSCFCSLKFYWEQYCKNEFSNSDRKFQFVNNQQIIKIRYQTTHDAEMKFSKDILASNYYLIYNNYTKNISLSVALKNLQIGKTVLKLGCDSAWTVVETKKIVELSGRVIEDNTVFLQRNISNSVIINELLSSVDIIMSF